MSDDADHPALKGYSPTWEKTKYFLGKTLKWALFGAAIAAAVVALPLMLPASIVSILPGGAWLMAHTAGAIVTNMAIMGGSLGALFGAAKGVSGMGEAADAEADRRVELMERSVTLNAQRQALNNLRAPQMGGMMPMGPGGMPLKDKGLRIS